MGYGKLAFGAHGGRRGSRDVRFGWCMAKSGTRKTHEQFFEEAIAFLSAEGKKLATLFPRVVDEYNDHSSLKLIAILYWVGIFGPIAHRQLRERYGYRVVYVDTMAGSGVTRTKRRGDLLCGSCTGAVLAAKQAGFPFDEVIGVEVDALKAEALRRRLESLDMGRRPTVLSGDIAQVSSRIAGQLPGNTISYVVVDPEGLEGLTWAGISPLLRCKGDAMVTWFENDLWRVKKAAETEADHKAAAADASRITELLGTEAWRDATEPSQLTNRFAQRVLAGCGKKTWSRVDIPKGGGTRYAMLLFAGNFPSAQKLATEWMERLSNRIRSLPTRDLSALLDVKGGRQGKLEVGNLSEGNTDPTPRPPTAPSASP